MIIGNKKQQDFLKEFLERENKGTVLLFGSKGVGKFSFLKEYLKEKPNWEKIFLTTENKNFQIDSARLLISLSTKKTEKRIIVIDEADKFQKEAQNTLLKTLEDTSSQTLFLLITHRFYKILPTIRSRSILVRFSLVEKEEVFNFLKNKGFKIEEINDVLNFYPGQPGKALELLENKHKLELIRKFLFISSEEKISLLDELKNNFSLSEFLEYYLIFQRKNLRNNPSKIRSLLDLYFDSDYNLNFEIQLANFILNYE